jgi:hypothetical protein
MDGADSAFAWLPPPPGYGATSWRDELAGQVGATCRQIPSGGLRQRSRFRASLRVVKLRKWLTPAMICPVNQNVAVLGDPFQLRE